MRRRSASAAAYDPVPGRLRLRGLGGDLLLSVTQGLVGGLGLPQGAGQPGAVMPQQQRHRAGHDRGERDDDGAGEPAGNLGFDRRQRVEPRLAAAMTALTVSSRQASSGNLRRVR